MNDKVNGKVHGDLHNAVNCARLKVAFAGTPEFAAVALDALIDSEHELVGVLTQPDRPAGRGRKLTASAVKQRAVAAGIPVLQPATLRSSEDQAALAALAPDVLVVAAYGLILPQAVLDLPPLGCLNIHASLLPRWRGAAPIHRAILHGDTHTGVCIMQMDAGLDTGDVLLEKRLAIGADETTAELHDRLAALGAVALLEAMAGRCDGTLIATAQSAEGVSYAEKLSKAEAVLDFSDSAVALHRRIRAFNPWPVAEAELLGQRVRIWRSRLVGGGVDGPAAGIQPGTIVALNDDSIRVATGTGSIELMRLQWPGKPAQEAAAFCQVRKVLGECFASR